MYKDEIMEKKAKIYLLYEEYSYLNNFMPFCRNKIFLIFLCIWYKCGKQKCKELLSFFINLDPAQEKLCLINQIKTTLQLKNKAKISPNFTAIYP